MKTALLPVALCFLVISAHAEETPVYTDQEAAAHSGEQASVRGKVVSVNTSSKGTTFLNFGARFPKQTFNAVAFASDQAALGDLKAFESKVVTVTGRIELAPDQTPRIVLKSAEQIKLADALPASAPEPVAPKPAPAMVTPAPPPPPEPAPMPTPAPAAPPTPQPKPLPVTKLSRSSAGKITLAGNWSSTTQGAEMTRKDLARLFGSAGTASEAVEVDTTLEIYPGVRMLAPLIEAKKSLHLEGLTSSKMRVFTPGLPPGSLSATTFSGIFPGGYGQLTLVTDIGDQVVSVLLLDASPRALTPNEVDTNGYHTFNFVTGKVKGSSDLAIRHRLITEDAPPGVVVVDSLLVDPADHEKRTGKGKSSSPTLPKNGRVLERSRWFVPEPLVNIILRCIGGKP